LHLLLERRRAPLSQVVVLLALAVGLLGCDSSGPDWEDPGSDSDSDADSDTDIEITTDDLPDGRVQLPYSAELDAIQTVGEVVWELSLGDLPPGLTLGETGVIDGTPELSGQYEFQVTAWDDEGEDTAVLAITVPDVVLISGYEPFGGYPTNPSWESAQELHEEVIAGLDVRAIELPVVWGVSWDLLLEEIELLHPRVVIGTGQADSNAMRFETTGRNEMWGEDNDGIEQNGEPIVEDGPYTVSSSLPVAEMAAAMEDGGYATITSNNAGLYLCNYLAYQIMYYQQTAADGPEAGGFIHVPPAPFAGSFSVEDITAAHELGIEAIASWLAGAKQTLPVEVDTFTAPTYFQSLP
jgi:pyroglutamyl-peptidase